jgi:hypothetical protein
VAFERVTLACFDIAYNDQTAGLPIAAFEPQWGDAIRAGFVDKGFHFSVEWKQVDSVYLSTQP